MKYISLDIETVPFEITDEDIKTYLMDKKISKERRSMDPNYSKIVVICVKILGEDVKIFFDDSEKKILEDFWNFLKENKAFVLVTHNGYKFDMPFVIVRSCVNNVDIPVFVNMNRWQMETSNHFDTMLFFSQYENFTNPNLEILAKLNGIEVPTQRLSGADVERIYKEGDLEKIKERCQQDVEILEKVFVKLCLNYLKSKVK